MSCRIQLLAAGEKPPVLRVSGWIQDEHVNAIKELIEGSNGVMVLDLEEVTLVDRDAVPFLAACELKGIALENCPRFLREWITKENLQKGRES